MWYEVEQEQELNKNHVNINSYYEGVVTDKNEFLCEITLDQKFTVFFHKIFQTGKTGLPEVKQKICIRNFKRHQNKFIILNSESVVDCSDYVYPNKTILFCEYAKKYNFSLKDILFIKKIIDRYKRLKIFNEMFLQSDLSINDIFIKVFTILPPKYVPQHPTALNFKEFEFYYPYKFDVTSKYLEKNCRNPELAYTVQKYDSNIKYFIGYLTFDRKNLSIVIRDGKKKLLCQILKSDHSIEDFLDEFVVIKKFFYIVEYFTRDNKYLEYLFFNLENVSTLNLTNKKKVNSILRNNITNYQICIVKHKAPVYFHYASLNTFEKTEVWLKLYFPKTKFECLAFSLYFLDMYKLITDGTELIFQLEDNFDLSKYEYHLNKEINRIVKSTNIKAYFLPQTIKIQINKNEKHHVEPLSPFEDAIKNFIPGEPVSFSAVIHSKLLNEPNSSRTGNITDSNANRRLFGTTGSQTHILNLTGVEDKSLKKKMYLSNYENSSCPLGLISGMKINVKYAIPHNNYIKACMMTNFNILEYIPYVDMNLKYNFTNDWDWGEPTLISSIGDPSAFANIWGRITFIDLMHVEFTSQCRVCGKKVSPLQELCCEEDSYKIHLELMFNARDNGGYTEITSENIEVFRLIFELTTDHEWENFIKMLNILKIYKFNKYGKKLFTDSPTEFTDRGDELTHYFDYFFDAFTYHMKSLDLRIKRNNDNTKWICTEARLTKRGRTIPYL